jgi:hypothetical protein
MAQVLVIRPHMLHFCFFIRQIFIFSSFRPRSHPAHKAGRLCDIPDPPIGVVGLLLLGNAEVADLEVGDVVHGDLKAHAHRPNLLAGIPHSRPRRSPSPASASANVATRYAAAATTAAAAPTASRQGNL